ncbi:M56 family metallopeptidase [Pedobacter montanisoli]|uniref:M56 family metallopeptidase n=1 Tax=Pedobacter montanisoli TaxID=2923277 RepID=A0ABS9ZVJ7_9SPHI|nr:M56 family metallopeptidase [Pedobacter montanisoli]MCJ0742019.1 M56 family metallopeptidase [Pedobacter montanisoli]
MNWSLYLLQINIYLVVFYLLYRTLLAKETYFILNRVFLIAAGILSLCIPFIHFDWFTQQPVTHHISHSVNQFNQFIIETSNANAVEQRKINWWAYIVGIYLLGIVFCLIKLVWQIFAVSKLFKDLKNGSAFSFLGRKAVDENLPHSKTINHHEDVHIKQFHTVDVLLFEIIAIITWFNPVIYAYKHAIKELHEYLADKEAAKIHGDNEAYAMLLLSQAFGLNNNSIAHGFLKKSMVKKRITMLYKQPSAKVAVLKYGLAVPALAFALMLSSARFKNNPQINALTDKLQLAEVEDVLTKVIPPTTPSEKVTIAEYPKASIKNSSEDLSSFYNELSKNLKYPVTSLNKAEEAYMLVRFKVADNKIVHVNTGSAPEDLQLEIVNALNNIPNKLKGGQYIIPVKFKFIKSPAVKFPPPIVKPDKNTTMLPEVVILAPEQDVPEPVYSFVSMENPPSFPGGIEKFYDFLSKNISYPKEAAENNIQGNVFISFVVEKDGSLTDLKVERKLGYGTDEEAIRVLKLSRRWNPGQINQKPVRTKYNIPIKFTLNSYYFTNS